jgi:hypothetical protein
MFGWNMCFGENHGKLEMKNSVIDAQIVII